MFNHLAAVKALGNHLVAMISHSESIVNDRHNKNETDEARTWFADELGEKMFPVISHRLPISHWKIVQIFPIKHLYVT